MNFILNCCALLNTKVICCVKIKVTCEACSKFLHEVILPCFVLNYAKCTWIENGKQKHVGKVEEVKDELEVEEVKTMIIKSKGGAKMNWDYKL
jgi:hypothetical protein